MARSEAQGRRQYLLLASGVVTGSIAGCTGESPKTGSDDGEASDETERQDETNGSGDEAGRSEPAGVAEIVTVGSAGYDPGWLTVGAGETVRWVSEERGHTITLYHRDADGDNNRGVGNGSNVHRAPADVSSFDVRSVPDIPFEHTFETPGVYDYFCRHHEQDGMVGSVIVGQPTAGEPGLAAPSELPEQAAERIEALNERTRSAFDLDR